MKSILRCDICFLEFESDELFWRDGDIETTNQDIVSQYLLNSNKDVCCDDCFNLVLKKSNYNEKELFKNNIFLEY